jgi:hypothetical protein
MSKAEPKPAGASATLETLAERCRLTITEDSIDGGQDFRFLAIDLHERIPVPANLPSIAGRHDGGEPAMIFLVPADANLSRKNGEGRVVRDLGNKMVREIKRELLEPGSVLIPEVEKLPEYLPQDDVIRDAIMRYQKLCWSEKENDLARREMEEIDNMLAGAARVEGTTPMLIDGLMRERGVSVVFGDWDEFKTTLVLDWAIHLAYGIPWQNRRVNGCPVLWYALEGVEEIPERVKAVQAQLKNGKGSAWGEGNAPIFVRDRIPATFEKWRDEVREVKLTFEKYHDNRMSCDLTPKAEYSDFVRYGWEGVPGLLLVIDTLSMALGEHDEKGPKAVAFVNDCLNLLKPDPEAENAEWRYRPPVEHVIIIHHQTKTATVFAGHRAIAANTSGLYRVFRHGERVDKERSMSFTVHPIRTKGMPRPPKMRFEAQIVPVPGADRQTVIVKNQATGIPKALGPIIEALREVEDDGEIGKDELNKCLDVVANKGGKDGGAKRKARQRYRDQLVKAGVIEPVDDENGNVTCYRFHDTVAV